MLKFILLFLIFQFVNSAINYGYSNYLNNKNKRSFTKELTVSGRIISNLSNNHNVFVQLWESNFNKDSFLNEKNVNNFGEFQVSGWVNKNGAIEPYLYIIYNCGLQQTNYLRYDLKSIENNQNFIELNQPILINCRQYVDFVITLKEEISFRKYF